MNTSGFINAFQSDALIKLGRTKNILLRIKQLKTGNNNLTLRYFLEVDDMYQAERALHNIFAAYRQGRSEWFLLPLDKHGIILLDKIFGECSEVEYRRLVNLGLRRKKE